MLIIHNPYNDWMIVHFCLVTCRWKNNSWLAGPDFLRNIYEMSIFLTLSFKQFSYNIHIWLKQRFPKHQHKLEKIQFLKFSHFLHSVLNCKSRSCNIYIYICMYVCIMKKIDFQTRCLLTSVYFIKDEDYLLKHIYTPVHLQTTVFQSRWELLCLK